MKEPLPPPVAAYLAASNGRNAEALIASFTSDAVVVDEGQTYRGTPELRTWFARTVEAYAFTLETIDFAAQRSEAVVTCQVSGNFDGSPVRLPFRFTFEDDKIAALTIGE